MRKSLHLFSIAFATVILSNATAFADGETSCRTEATLAADEWAKGNVLPVSEAENAETTPLVIISSGRKYVVARDVVYATTLRPNALGELAIQRKQVYHEELDRCLGRLTMEIVGPHPLHLKREKPKYTGQK